MSNKRQRQTSVTTVLESIALQADLTISSSKQQSEHYCHHSSQYTSRPKSSVHSPYDA